MKLKDTLLPILEEALAWDLSETEAIEYVATYDPRNRGKRPDERKKIGRRTFYDWKKEIESDDSLNQYFNHHTRIGFVHNQKKRMAEAEEILKHLKHRFLALMGNENSDVYRLTRIADSMEKWSKRADEISLSNPVIAQIKIEVDKTGDAKSPEETEPDGQAPLSQYKF